MGRNLWWRVIRRKVLRSSARSCHHHHNSNAILVIHTNINRSSFNSSADEDAIAGIDFVSRGDIAAVTIQACFRGHLARRAYRALRSLVKLQALVRGVVVRRQARIALHYMHVLARLQITVRARQLLLNN